MGFRREALMIDPRHRLLEVAGGTPSGDHDGSSSASALSGPGGHRRA
jgi:hypothetical protein